MPWPNFPDPRAHREEELTLARIASKQNGVSPVNNGPQTPARQNTPSSGTPKDVAVQRRRFVFTDPVAFRFVPPCTIRFANS